MTMSHSVNPSQVVYFIVYQNYTLIETLSEFIIKGKPHQLFLVL